MQDKSDPFHSFPLVVENYGEYAEVHKILGNDGVERTLVRLRGFYHGKEGHFEWIIEPDGKHAIIGCSFLSKSKCLYFKKIVKRILLINWSMRFSSALDRASFTRYTTVVGWNEEDSSVQAGCPFERARVCK